MVQKDGFNAWAVPYSKARAVLIPAPWEGGASGGKGQAKGPAAILKASGSLPPYDEELGLEPYKQGLALLPPLKLARLRGEQVAERVRVAVGKALREDKLPLLLGGDHSVSIGAFQALARERPGASVLYLDAHPDVWRQYHGDRYSHATPLRWAHELGLRTVAVGARHVHKEEVPFIRRVLGGRVHWMHEIERQGMDAVVRKVLAQLGKEVYVSVDLDVLGPGDMPSTGTSEPGGLRWHDLLKLLSGIAERKRLVGADVVELAPIKGLEAPNYLAARLAYKLFAYASCLRGRTQQG